MTRRGPGQRAGLDRQQVLAAARDLLASRGLDGMTMRALAEQLAVAPNTLYSHVANKTALLDEVLDDVLGAVETDGLLDGEPVDGLTRMMTSTYQVLLEHADLVPLYLARQGARRHEAQRLGAVMIQLLARAGVDGDRAQDAQRVLIVYTIGFAAFSSPSGSQGGQAPGPVPPSELAHSFGQGLNWLLLGVLGSPVGADLQTGEQPNGGPRRDGGAR